LIASSPFDHCCTGSAWENAPVRRSTLCALLLSLLAACASKTVQQINRTNVAANAEQIAVVGAPFIWRETGSVESNEHWEGVLFGGMHHSNSRGPDYQKVELYYGGRSGDTLTFLYQVTRGNDETPSGREPYQVSLAQGSSFTVAGLQIQCLSADAGTMRYRVLSADSRWRAPASASGTGAVVAY
jgi:hypothetical protein